MCRSTPVLPPCKDDWLASIQSKPAVGRLQFCGLNLFFGNKGSKRFVRFFFNHGLTTGNQVGSWAKRKKCCCWNGWFRIRLRSLVFSKTLLLLEDSVLKQVTVLVSRGNITGKYEPSTIQIKWMGYVVFVKITGTALMLLEHWSVMMSLTCVKIPF